MATTTATTTATEPRKRTLGGFVDDDSDTEDEGNVTPPAKKRMLEHHEHGTNEAAETHEQDTLDVPDDDSIPDAQTVDPAQQQLLEEEDRYDLLFHGNPGELPLLEPEPVRLFRMQTCAGKVIPLRPRKAAVVVPYDAMVAARSRTKEGRAKRSYYGIDIHALIDGAQLELKKKKEKKEAVAAAAAAAATAAADADVMMMADEPMHSVEVPKKKKKRTQLWTEKYRARNFLDLVGDDLTNRIVLQWLKRWDPIVFPHAAKGRRRPVGRHGPGGQPEQEEERAHRKILILAGPPGLGKTTLAHVCARQAGYEVLEINASDERSRDVVNGRIRTSLGTESVKTLEQGRVADGADQKAKARAKVARPVCVIVDEVDGVVGGSGGSGEGGFVKALIDLVQVDQRNSGTAAGAETHTHRAGARNRRKKDDFRQMRPLILICNDVYHAALRPLRQSGLAEVVHVGKPSADTVVVRLKSIFEKEGIACEREAARKVCEAAWGMAASAQEARRGAEGAAEGDLRGVMVVGEWVARRLRAAAEEAAAAKRTTAAPTAKLQLTRQWVDRHVLADMASGGVGARGLGRGGVRDIVSRVFLEGAGFPRTAAGSSGLAPVVESADVPRAEQPREQMGFAEHQHRVAAARLREMIETSGEVDRIMTEAFAEYPGREFNDDLYLSKPDAAYEWLHFHDMLTRRVFGRQEWELAAYTSQPVLAWHELFASSRRHVAVRETAEQEGAPPVSALAGPRADFAAREAEKECRAALLAIQAQLPLSLLRGLRSAEDVAVDFLPYLVRLVAPDVQPVLVNVGGDGKGGSKFTYTSVASVRRDSEKVLVRRAAAVLAALGIALHKGVLEDTTGGRPQWVYRMEPDIDLLASFSTAAATGAPTRYAVRQVLDQELRKTLAQQAADARQARFAAGRPVGGGPDREAVAGKGAAADKAKTVTAAAADDVKRDFFGRVVVLSPAEQARRTAETEAARPGSRVWVTFHEGLNNAVRKPMSVGAFLQGL